MAFVHVPVSLIWDSTMGFLTHDAWVPVPPGPPVLVPSQFSVEMLIPQAWPGGLLFNNHKFSTKVFHYGSPVTLDGHDCGPGIMDLTPFIPTNLKYPLIWLKSSRKYVWKTTSVDHDGKKVGCAALWPPLPMMTCGDPISAPTAFLNSNILNSEKVGLSLADFLLGLAAAAVSMLIDYVFSKIGEDKSFQDVDIWSEVAGEFTKSVLGPDSGKDWAKWGANQAAGIVLSVFGTDDQGNFQWQAPNVEISIGMGKVGYNFAGEEGERGTAELSHGVMKADLAKGEAHAFGTTF